MPAHLHLIVIIKLERALASVLLKVCGVNFQTLAQMKTSKAGIGCGGNRFRASFPRTAFLLQKQSYLQKSYLLSPPFVALSPFLCKELEVSNRIPFTGCPELDVYKHCTRSTCRPCRITSLSRSPFPCSLALLRHPALCSIFLQISICPLAYLSHYF